MVPTRNIKISKVRGIGLVKVVVQLSQRCYGSVTGRLKKGKGGKAGLWNGPAVKVEVGEVTVEEPNLYYKR